MRLLTFLLCLPVLALADGRHDHRSHGAHAGHKPIAWQAVDARFETTACQLPCQQPGSSVWSLRRGHDSVELRGADAWYSELWRLLSDGSIDYAFAMHDDKRVIEYNPVDLQIINKTPDWERLGAIVAARDLERLKIGEVGLHAGYTTHTYSGVDSGTRIEIVWIPELMLPLKVDTRNSSGYVSVQLLAFDAQGMPPMPDAVRERYQRVDYADLGDMEEDPNAKVWIQKASKALGHGSHAH